MLKNLKSMGLAEYSRLSGSDMVRELTKRTDSEIISLFEAHTLRHEKRWALIALGGYGRSDLCPYSDLDLLLLIENRKSRAEIESIVEAMLYPLWDKGFNASYSVRTIKETLKDAKRDFFFRTSLIDMRFICGSDLPFKELNKVLEKNRALNNTRRFMSDLLFHTRMRQEKYGDVSYILEPDIKDGHGGLRDYHAVAWASCILSHGGFPISDILPINERHRLDDAYDFMVKTRFMLHELSGRKNDRMYLEYQEALAENLGFKEGNAESGVEAFMRHFYKMALTIRSLSDDFLLSLAHMLGLIKSPPNRLIDNHFQVFSGQLAFRHSKVLESRPHLIMHAFELISQKDYTLSPSARSDIRDLLVKGCDLRHNTLAHEAFFRVLLSQDPGRGLTGMLELGIFECFIPEFETIKGRTIFDLYHTYTVDIHSINTITELKRLEHNEVTCSR
ncbi:MAG: hypothetical protein JXM72_09235, partial [Deltaproteobacteria bacterium]|nr:hypothetical protein [Deltaproteobacteria bacterium]